MKHDISKDSLICECCEKKFERRSDKVLAYKQKSDEKILCKNCLSKFHKSERLKNGNPLATEIDNPTGGRFKWYDIECKFCEQHFQVPYALRSRIFCSKKCQLKGGSHKISCKQKSKCIECGKEIEGYGPRKICSKYCSRTLYSRSRIGENNPAWKEDKYITTECVFCENEFTYTRGGMNKEAERFFCNKECYKGWQKLGDHKKRFNKISLYDPSKYIGYSARIRDEILERDNYTCQICNKNKDDKEILLDVHHIDYDTNNQEYSNLICLCKTCHNWTNSNRDFWRNVFLALKAGEKVVIKEWGLESHIHNDKNFCLKYLIFWKGGKLSQHKHLLKTEKFLCIQGKFGLTILKDGIEKKSIIKAGKTILLEPGIYHSLEAFTNAIIIEVSTEDFPEDSYRLDQSSYNPNNDENIKNYE
jgi:quercetin dioxygenase-like cupin family protein